MPNRQVASIFGNEDFSAGSDYPKSALVVEPTIGEMREVFGADWKPRLNVDHPA